MVYKVVLVEDEIVTREGIRDNVDWKAHGFEFAGEATDGEVALPLLEATKPDLLLTDIKMPFMDGLQLSRIVRERLPAVKIIIISGHDEFEYAQEAIKIGVTDYILKPVSVQDLHNILRKVGAQLSQERKEQQDLQELKERVAESQLGLRERFLLKLVVGAVSPMAVIEQSEQLGLDLIARYYMVIVIRIEPCERPGQFDYQQYQQLQEIVSRVVENNPDVFLLEKDLGELVLLLKGNTREYLLEESGLLLERIEKLAQETGCRHSVNVGSIKERITELYQSYIEALVNLQHAANGFDSTAPVDKKELLKVDKSTVEDYLRRGVREGFDQFFDTYIRPMGELTLKSPIVKNYVLMDIILATAKFVNELGGNIDLLVPDLNNIGKVWADVKTMDQIKEQTENVLMSAMVFRDSRTGNQYGDMIRQAKEYIEHNFASPTLSLSDVAAQVNLSPSHFSTVFSQETGQTFKEYLTDLRIARAKELLRTTVLRSFEVADQIGYNDPHYFSFVFRKTTGLSPKEFRLQAQVGAAQS